MGTPFMSAVAGKGRNNVTAPFDRSSPELCNFKTAGLAVWYAMLYKSGVHEDVKSFLPNVNHSRAKAPRAFSGVGHISIGLASGYSAGHDALMTATGQGCAIFQDPLAG